MRLKDKETQSLDGRQTLTLFGIPCIIPKGMKVVEMWKTTPYILGKGTPAYAWGDKIRVNPNLLPWFDIEVLFEECIHCFQYRRMDRALGFFPTYLWEGFLDLINKRGRKGKSLHNANLIEEEAMRGANEIVRSLNFDGTTIDIEKEIKKYFGW